MKHMCASLMLTLFALMNSAHAQNGLFKFSSGQSPFLSGGETLLAPLKLDNQAPVSTTVNPCTGQYQGTATDMPSDSTIRTNFQSVVLAAGSVNYKLTVDSITPGVTVSVKWKLDPIDYTKPANADVVFTDVKGNSSTLHFVYAAALATVPQSMSLDSLTPKKSYTIRVPLTNTNSTAIQVRNIRLADGKTGFSFGVQPPQILIIAPNATEYIVLRFSGDKPGQYTDALRLNTSCNDTTEQRIPLSARIGSVAIKIESLDFGLVDVGSTKTLALTATNIGTAEASLSQLGLKDGNKGFTLRNTITLPIVLKAGQSITIAQVDFKPTSDNAASDNVSYDIAEDELGTLNDPEVKGNGRIVSVEDELQTSFALLPNPAHDELRIQMAGDKGTPYRVELLDTKGAVVRSENMGSTMSEASFTLPLHDIPDGLYFCKLMFSNGWVVQRVMVVH